MKTNAYNNRHTRRRKTTTAGAGTSTYNVKQSLAVEQDIRGSGPLPGCSRNVLINVAVVGLGVISKYYFASLQESGQFKLSAICDIDPSKLNGFGRDVMTTTRMEDLAEMDDLDAVVVNLPNGLHYEACKQFLKAGKSVCCEKPLAIDPAQAEHLEKLAASQGVAMFTAFHRRYNVHVLRLKDEVRSRGRVKRVRVRYFEKIEEHCGTDQWYLRPEQCGGGVVIDNGTNVFDLLVYLVGRFKIEEAEIVRGRSGLDVRASIQGSTVDGVSVEALLDWEYEHGERKDVCVTYEDGHQVSIDLIEGFEEFKSSLYHEYGAVLAEFAAFCREPLAKRKDNAPDGCFIAQLVSDTYAAAREVERITDVPVTHRRSVKQAVPASLVKVLEHTRTNRGMTLLAEQSRVLQRNEVHELVVTDQKELKPFDAVDRVGFIGFANINESGIVDVGDKLVIGHGTDSRTMGQVVGFDDCHTPNHLNIIIEVSQLTSGSDLGLQVNEAMTFAPFKAGLNSEQDDELPILLVGFGNAGRKLHYPCIVKTLDELGKPIPTLANPLLVIDPSLASIEAASQMHENIRLLSSALEVPSGYGQRAIAHVCTPPSIRVAPIRELLECGVRRFILEKPLASSRQDVAELNRLFDLHNANVLVVSNWSTSQLTDALVARIHEKSKEGIRLRAIYVSHTKSRIRRTVESNSHTKASEIEMPHMVVLALILGEAATGSMETRITRALHWDLSVGDLQVPNMGGVDAHLSLGGEIDAFLYSNLLSPYKQKVVKLEFDDGTTIHGSFPIDSTELYATLLETDEAGREVRSDCFFDDTLKQYLHRSYQHFLSNGDPPSSDFKLHLRVNSILADIDSASGLDIDPNPNEESGPE